MHIATGFEGKLFGLDAERVWDTRLAYAQLEAAGEVQTKRTAERRLQALELLPPLLTADSLLDEHGRSTNSLVLNWALDQARKRRQRVLFVQLYPLPSNKPCLHANDARGARFWLPLANTEAETVRQGLQVMQQYLAKPVCIFAHGALVAQLRQGLQLAGSCFYPQIYQAQIAPDYLSKSRGKPKTPTSAHLKRLEAESIYILREAAAEAQNPVMLYSVGKDSGVMLHLARKAFYPSPPPFPLLHVDTRWKFQEMYQFRDLMAEHCGMELLVYTNPEAIEKDINPFDHGSALHTDITKTEGLKQALNKYKFDVVFGGARRDEEKSRAKERIFSFRTATHQWDPKNQRPELWRLFNTRKNNDESIRVFPLSNWTEQDIWQYIYQENIPMVPLYFAQPRAVVQRADMLMLVDDARFRLLPGERIQIKNVRFRTLGCYPLTGAVESQASSLTEVLHEVVYAQQSERQGRKIDTDSAGSMEKKKQEGYF